MVLVFRCSTNSRCSAASGPAATGAGCGAPPVLTAFAVSPPSAAPDADECSHLHSANP